MSTSASASAIASAAGCISAQWKGAETGSSSARLAPFALAISTARSTARLVARDHNLRRVVVVGRLADLALRRLLGHRARGRRSRAPAAPPWRQRRPAPPPASPCRAILSRRAVSVEAQRARRAQRRVFAQRMAGDEARRVHRHAFCRQGSHRRHRGRHQRRLRVRRQRQRLGRPFPHQRAQLLAQRLVDLLEYGRRSRIGVRQVAAHADRLGALSGKRECAHRCLPRHYPPRHCPPRLRPLSGPPDPCCQAEAVRPQPPAAAHGAASPRQVRHGRSPGRSVPRASVSSCPRRPPSR